MCFIGHDQTEDCFENKSYISGRFFFLCVMLHDKNCTELTLTICGLPFQSENLLSSLTQATTKK